MSPLTRIVLINLGWRLGVQPLAVLLYKLLAR